MGPAPVQIIPAAPVPQLICTLHFSSRSRPLPFGFSSSAFSSLLGSDTQSTKWTPRLRSPLPAKALPSRPSTAQRASTRRQCADQSGDEQQWTRVYPTGKTAQGRRHSSSGHGQARASCICDCGAGTLRTPHLGPRPTSSSPIGSDSGGLGLQAQTSRSGTIISPPRLRRGAQVQAATRAASKHACRGPGTRGRVLPG